MLDHATLGGRHLDRLHSAKQLADKAGHDAGRFPAGAAIALDAVCRSIGDDAHKDKWHDGQQGDDGADAKHDNKGDDAEDEQAQNVVDPQTKQRDLEHVPAKPTDGLAGRIR